MKITVDGKVITPAVAAKVLHLQAECAGVLSDVTLDAIARDLMKGSRT
jgi:hypothetical protein